MVCECFSDWVGWECAYLSFDSRKWQLTQPAQYEKWTIHSTKHGSRNSELPTAPLPERTV